MPKHDFVKVTRKDTGKSCYVNKNAIVCVDLLDEGSVIKLTESDREITETPKLSWCGEIFFDKDSEVPLAPKV